MQLKISNVRVAMLALFAIVPIATLIGQPALAQAAKDTPEEVQQQLAKYDTSKPVVGFGFQIRDDKVTVVRVLPNSAAETAGLEVGMVILRINGVTMRDFSLVDIAKILGAIDGEIIFDIEGRGRYSLIKAPIPPQNAEE